LPHDEAVRRLQEASGTQFDPTAVNAFVRLYESDQILALET
jgi:HD-GYP domain-containing protein (c-di-GMP phosphodiesterase class II)